MTTKEQILALAGEPTLAFRRRGHEDFCTCDARRHNELARKPALFEVKVFYTADQVLAAVKLLESEINALKAERGLRHVQELRQQLAAAQLHIKQYREALEAVDAQCIQGHVFDCAVKPPTHWLNKASAALSQPTDTTALQALIAKAGEVMRERVRNQVSLHLSERQRESISALPGVTLEDLQG